MGDKQLRLSGLTLFSLFLASVGSINWGLTLFGFNLVEWLSQGTAMIANTVYALVAVFGGLYLGGLLYTKLMDAY